MRELPDMPKKALAVYRSLDSPEWLLWRLRAPLWLPLQTKGQANFDIEIATLARRTGEQATLRKASAGGRALITSAEVLEWELDVEECEGVAAPTTTEQQSNRTKTTIPFGKRLPSEEGGKMQRQEVFCEGK